MNYLRLALCGAVFIAALGYMFWSGDGIPDDIWIMGRVDDLLAGITAGAICIKS